MDIMATDIDKQDIIDDYFLIGSLCAIARKHKIGTQAVRRVLITEGVNLVTLPNTQKIQQMLTEMSPEEVAAALKISVKTVRSYQPYSKGSYVVGEKSINAQHIKKCRKNKMRP